MASSCKTSFLKNSPFGRRVVNKLRQAVGKTAEVILGRFMTTRNLHDSREKQLFQGSRNFQAGISPLLVRRGGRENKKMSRSLLLRAAGVVAFEPCFGMHFLEYGL